MVNNSFVRQTNKVICNAFDCSETATQKVNVSGGKFGTITLDLCESCVELFQK